MTLAENNDVNALFKARWGEHNKLGEGEHAKLGEKHTQLGEGEP